MPKRLLYPLSIILIVALLLAHFCRFDSLIWSHVHAYTHGQPAETVFDLEHYQVDIDAKRIAGLKELSGLTYNPDRNSLFTVMNKPTRVIELGLDGRVLRSIPVQGAEDVEGISHVDGDRYVLVNEPDQRIILLSIDDATTSLDVQQGKQLMLPQVPGKTRNKNFEGVSWDSVNRRLLVVKERSPMTLLAVHDFIDTPPGRSPRVETLAFEDGKFKGIRDLSSVTYHDPSGHTLLLSDESRLVVDYDASGKRVGHLIMWRGYHGLKRHVPQAEGIAVDNDKNIYVVSEPNLFYVFKPASRH